MINSKGKWITLKGGRHIFLKDGQTITEAIKEYSKQNHAKTEKDIDGKSYRKLSDVRVKKGNENITDKTYNISKQAKKRVSLANRRLNKYEKEGNNVSNHYGMVVEATTSARGKEQLERDYAYDNLRPSNMKQEILDKGLERRKAFFFGNSDNKLKEDYLNKYNNSWDSEKEIMRNSSGENVINLSFKDDIVSQVEERIKSKDLYRAEDAKDFEARVFSNNPKSTLFSFLADKENEAKARKQYGDAKVDTALYMEMSLLRDGYDNIKSSISSEIGNANIMKVDNKYSDLIISGDNEKTGISVQYNFNKEGIPAITLSHIEGNSYKQPFVITPENRNEVTKIITSGTSEYWHLTKNGYKGFENNSKLYENEYDKYKVELERMKYVATEGDLSKYIPREAMEYMVKYTKEKIIKNRK